MRRRFQCGRNPACSIKLGSIDAAGQAISVAVSVSTRTAGEPGQGRTSRSVSAEPFSPASGFVFIVIAAI